jgi:hypothetical protein
MVTVDDVTFKLFIFPPTIFSEIIQGHMQNQDKRSHKVSKYCYSILQKSIKKPNLISPKNILAINVNLSVFIRSKLAKFLFI